jgi:hypothetical protein
MDSMNMGRQRARRIMKEWAILFGLLVPLHLLLFLGWVLLDPDRSTPIALMVGVMAAYTLTFTVIIVVFYLRLRRATWPPEFRVAREQGVPTTAHVLEIAPTGWRSTQGSSTSFTWRPVKGEYQMRLRVTGRGAGDYEVIVAEYLTAAQVPKIGATIPVKVHPQRPEIVVLTHDATT